MKSARFTLQIVILLLQIYFFTQTVLMHVTGFAYFPFRPIEDAWSSMIFTLLIALACEIFALADAVLFAISHRSIYSFVYLALLLVNAYLFATLLYYSTPGTVACMLLYAALFVLRILHFVSSLSANAKTARTSPY